MFYIFIKILIMKLHFSNQDVKQISGIFKRLEVYAERLD